MNNFPLGDELSNLPKWGDLPDKRHDELASDVKDDFGSFKLSIVVIEDSSDLEIRDLFLRLQEGVSLNPAEKRNAMVGTMRDFVSDVGRPLSVSRESECLQTLLSDMVQMIGSPISYVSNWRRG